MYNKLSLGPLLWPLSPSGSPRLSHGEIFNLSTVGKVGHCLFCSASLISIRLGWSNGVLGADVRHVGSQEPAGGLKEVGRGFRSTGSEKKPEVSNRQLYKTSDTACPTGGEP